MKKFTLAAATAALAMTATALFAAPGDVPGGMDADGNGTITRTETQAAVVARFAKADTNGDGVLNEADKAARMGQMFDRMDADKNGSISRAEFTAAHSAKGGGHEGMDHGKMAGRGMGGHRMGGGGAGMMLKMADANKDGAVTRDEATAAALSHFDRMDANKNGQVTRAERQAAMQAMGARMRGNSGTAPPPPTDDDQ
ncbi:MAG: EF-hand domain-containing protein [Novosphingobium sp.]|nr:EF-hand domain-containing protein [Novosphingobium sp.]